MIQPQTLIDQMEAAASAGSGEDHGVPTSRSMWMKQMKMPQAMIDAEEAKEKANG